MFIWTLRFKTPIAWDYGDHEIEETIEEKEIKL